VQNLTAKNNNNNKTPIRKYLFVREIKSQFVNSLSKCKRLLYVEISCICRAPFSNPRNYNKLRYYHFLIDKLKKHFLILRQTSGVCITRVTRSCLHSVREALCCQHRYTPNSRRLLNNVLNISPWDKLYRDTLYTSGKRFLFLFQSYWEDFTYIYHWSVTSDWADACRISLYYTALPLHSEPQTAHM
jgi:hypothetical protein